MIAYHRTALAQQLVQALQGRTLLGDAHNGLFLAAPRRTGKSRRRRVCLGTQIADKPIKPAACSCITCHVHLLPALAAANRNAQRDCTLRCASIKAKMRTTLTYALWCCP